MEENKANQWLDFLKRVPVLSVPNAMRMTPYDHEGNIYYFKGTMNNTPLSFCVNTARQQWYADKHNHGDDAASLALYISRTCIKHLSEEEAVKAISAYIASNLKHGLKTPQRIPFKPLPLRGRKWVAKRYDRAINASFIQGLSSAMLRQQCYVVYHTKCPAGEEDKETLRLLNLMRVTKDLYTLSRENSDAIQKNFTSAIALRNVNGGLQIYNGEFSYPEKSEGYCLFGGDNVQQGEKLYVYENIMDYLAMQERLHASGTEFIMPLAHHLVINGESNLAEALTYIHDRCDYLNVVCLFPNDNDGQRLLEKVNHATNDTAEDASRRMYADQHFFSLYAKAANIFDHADYQTKQKEMERIIERELTQRKDEIKKSDSEEKKEEKVIEIPSAPKQSMIEQVKETIKGLGI